MRNNSSHDKLQGVYKNKILQKQLNDISKIQSVKDMKQSSCDVYKSHEDLQRKEITLANISCCLDIVKLCRQISANSELLADRY